jgi:hypothetical protein
MEGISSNERRDEPSGIRQLRRQAEHCRARPIGRGVKHRERDADDSVAQHLTGKALIQTPSYLLHLAANGPLASRSRIP